MKRTVLMKHSMQVWSLLTALAAFTAVYTPAQVVQSAQYRHLSLSVGVLGTASQPDFDPDLIAFNVAQASPQRLYGITAFADIRASRWIQIELATHQMRYNQYKGIDGTDPGVSQSTYLGGLRLPLVTYMGFTPYAKVLGGIGTMSSVYLDGPAFTLAYGGGLDYRLSKHFSARLIDFEMQRWSVQPTPLQPYNASIGLSYKIF
jgi:hypothetical protein